MERQLHDTLIYTGEASMLMYTCHTKFAIRPEDISMWMQLRKLQIAEESRQWSVLNINLGFGDIFGYHKNIKFSSFKLANLLWESNCKNWEI